MMLVIGRCLKGDKKGQGSGGDDKMQFEASEAYLSQIYCYNDYNSL